MRPRFLLQLLEKLPLKYFCSGLLSLMSNFPSISIVWHIATNLESQGGFEFTTKINLLTMSPRCIYLVFLKDEALSFTFSSFYFFYLNFSCLLLRHSVYLFKVVCIRYRLGSKETIPKSVLLMGGFKMTDD